MITSTSLTTLEIEASEMEWINKMLLADNDAAFVKSVSSVLILFVLRLLNSITKDKA